MRRQPLELVLEHVIGRAALERLDGDLLAERPGDEDEGCRGSEFARDVEGVQAVEGRQEIIGQDQIPGPAVTWHP